MAEASYTSKIKFSIDELMNSLVACKSQAEQVDGVLSNIGKRGNLNNFIKQFVAMDDAVKALRKELDSVKAGLGDKLNNGWMKSFDEMVAKMSQISELSRNIFEGLNGVNLKDKGVTKELRSYAEQLNAILKNVGIDKQIDLELFNTKDVQAQFDELIQYAGELNGKLNVTLGEIDLSKFGDNIKSAGDKVSGNIKEAGGKISAEVQQQIDELEKQKAKYQEALDIFSGKGTRVKTTKKNDVATLTNLVDEFKKAELELSRKEQGSSGYEEAFARKVKAATLLKNTADYVADHGSNKGSEYVAMYSKEYDKAQQFLEKFSEKQKTILEKIKNDYKQKIQEINTEIAKFGKEVPETKNEPKNATISYEKLTKSVERYYELQRKLDTAADSNEFNKIADEADKIAESFINMDSACSAVFDSIQDGLGKSEALNQLADIFNIQPSGVEAGAKATQEAADAARKKADEEERAYQAITKSVEAQRLMYHLGTGSAINGRGTRRDTFADMLDNLTTNAKGTRYEKYGYGLLGSGIFGVQNPNTIPKEQAASTSKFIYSLDLSKYNMYLLDTEERATNLMDFMSKLQKIAIRGALPDYTGFNEFLGNTDLNSLYEQFKTLFDETKFTKEQLGSFIDEMVSQLTQAGLFFDSEKGQLDFRNISDELANSDNISTRFFKKLGYHGVNVGNTSLDGFGQGSVLFDFNQSDIVGYFNTIEQAAQDFQNNLKNGWVGSNEQLQQYLINIEEIIAKISAAKQNKLQILPDYDTSEYDNTLTLLNNVKANISNILSGATSPESSNFATVTEGQTAQLEKEKELVQEITALKEKLNNIPTNPVDASELEAAQKQVQALKEEIFRMECALDSWKNSYYDIEETLSYSIPISEVEQNMTSNDVVDEYRAQIETLKSTINQLNEKLATTKTRLTDIQTVDSSSNAGDASLKEVESKIQSYEELCEVVKRYNELVLKSHSENLTDSENKEIDKINSQFAATKGVLNDPDKYVNYDISMSRMRGFLGEYNTDQLAQYLGIEIPHAASSAGTSIDNLRTKAEDLKTKFLELTQSLDSDLFAGRYDEFSLGKSQAELDKAQQELQELADAGYIAADAMEQVNSAYQNTSNAITASYEGIKNENMFKEDSGSYDCGYDRGYDDGYFAAEKRYEQDVNSYIHEINELTKRSESLESQLSQMQSTKNQVSESTSITTTEIDSANKVNESFAEATTQKNQFVEANVKVKESAESSAIAIDKEVQKVREASEAFADAASKKNDFANANKNVKDTEESTKKESKSKKPSSNGYQDSDTYKTLIDANKKLSSAFKKIDTEVFVDKDSDLGQLKTRYEEITKQIQELTKSEDAFGKASEDDLQKLSSLTKQLMADIGQYAKAKKEASKQNDSVYGSDIFQKVQSKYTGLVNNISNNGYSDASGIANKLQQYEQAYQRILDLQKKLANIDITSDLGKKTAAEFDDAVKSFNNYGKEIENIIKKSENLQNKIGNIHRAVSESFDLGDQASRRSELEAFARSFGGLDEKSIQFSDSYSKVVFTIKNGNGEIEKITASFNQAGTAIDASSKNLGKAANKFTSFFDGVKKKTGEIATYFTGANLVYKAVAQIRQGITYVKEIDTALTELKKVTDETDATYKKFLTTASQTAGQIGSTVKDFTNATADFARLGYNIEQASDLAKAASVYYNVGDDLANIGEASDSIISTMHGFGIEAENAMNIVDKFNEVGNNFAISSSGIGQALLRSASAMSEAGNTIDESIGLITAANSVVQNPESVGTAMKTLSLRIRGAKVELEDAGEDVDGMANSVSELQKKLLALTGGKVNIMLDENTFKNTTEILREMSTVWDDMTDVNRAAALELLGGKRQANVLAAVIKNFDLVEGAIKTSSDAAGSAMAENEKYMASIQGHIDQFNNSVQTMWMNLINSDAVKSIVDIGTDITGLITKFGLLGTVITAVFGTKLFKAAKSAWDMAKTATDAEYAKAEASKKAAEAKAAEAAAQAAEAAVEKADNKTTAENAQATAAKAAAAEAASKAKEAEAAQNASEAATEKANSAAKNASKFSFTGIKSGASKLKSIVGKFLGTTVGKVTAAGVVIGGVAAAVKLTKNYIERKQAELAQEVQDLTNNYKETKTKIDANLKSLSESSESTQYQTLSDEFSVLAAGVDRYGNNISLTSDQYERYKSICEQIIGIQPSLAEGYDSATKAIGNNANALKDLITLQQDAARRSAEEYTSDDNLKKARKNTINKIKEAKKDIEDSRTTLGSSLISGLKAKTGTDYGATGTASDDIAREIMTEVLGYDPDNVDNILKEYFNKNSDINTAWNRWLSDYASQIKEHRQGIADLIGDVDKSNDFQTAISNYATAADSISQAQEDFINTLLQVPMSQIDYSKLGDSGKSFITEWIKNSDAFKIDETTSKSTVLEMKKTIRGMVTELANNEEAQDILDSLFTIDTSKTNFEQYKKDVNEWLDMLFESLGITDKDEQNRIKIALGFDFEVEDEEGNTKQGQLVKDIARVTGDTEENIQEWLDSQPAAKVQALMQVDWSAESGLTTDEVLQKVESTIPKEVTVSKTYSDLKNSIDEVNDTLSQSSEIIIDNVELTEEQGKAIESLIGTEEDFADAIDTTNGYVVKNATLLKKLLNTKKQEALQNVKISKSQARLQYYELYKKIRQLSQGNQELAIAHKEEINALYAEMGAIEKTIAKYSMLEQQLLGATNAYEKFEEAKTIDEEKDYGSKASDMLSGLIQGLQSAKLGTESFQAAVSGMIPEDVYSGLSTVEEKVQAIANYLKNSNFSKYFTLEFEDDGTLQSAEMKLDNVKAFIEDAQEVGALTNKGDWKHFELDESIKTLDDFCNAMQITKEMAFAMFTEIDSYDAEWLNGDFGSMLDNLDLGLEGNIFMASKHITELDVALANGKISAEEYAAAMYGTGAAATESQKEIGGLAGQMQQYTQSARESASEWKKASDGYEESKKKVEDLSKQIQQATKGADTSELEEKLKSAMEDMDKYAATMRDNEVSELVIKVAMDDVDNSIKLIEDKYSGIKNLIEQDNENGGFKIKTGINWESAPADEDTVNSYLALLNEKHTLEVMQGESLPTTLDVMQEMRDTLKTITEILAKHYGVNIETGEAEDSITGILNQLGQIKPKSVVITVLGNISDTLKTWWGRLTGSGELNGSANDSTDAKRSRNNNVKVNGTAHATGSWGLKSSEHNALVGELGMETVVDPNTGKYYTVGNRGAEFVDLPRGAIIFNHKQTEALFKNGYVTSRGKMLANGNAHATGNAHVTIVPDFTTPTYYSGASNNNFWTDWNNSISDSADSISDASSAVEDAADDAKQTIDFIEYRLEEIENSITNMTNRVENFLDDTSQTKEKNNLYEGLIDAEKQKASTYLAAAETYNKKAAQLLSEVPAQYQEMAKNGAIAIKDFIGESEGEIADAIEEYRTWSTKADDAENNYLASIAEISAKRLEQLKDIADDFENIVGLIGRQSDILQGEMDLLEESGERLSENFYKELMKDSQKQISDLNNKRASLQDVLDQSVKSGDVKVGSDDWYEMVNTIYDVDDAILECKKDIEGFQNSINDLYWDNLDKLIDKIDNVDSELSHLYNLVSDEEKVVDEFGNWTKDGVTALGLLAQQLEVANFKVEQYGEAIARLEKDYAAGLYSTDEYNEKLAELKENQWDAIEAQESAKKSIIDLNKTRVQAVKDGLQKEIDAFSELIDKKKEELSLQKEAHDFSKQVEEQQKNIADIQKRLAAMSGDNSASAIAQKKKLQAELSAAQKELEELYYDHSVEKQQEALDKQLENYQNSKDKEMDALDESLKNENQVIQDSYATITANTESLASNLTDIADRYGISLSDSVTKPWENGANAIGTYQDKLNTATSAFTKQLRIIKQGLIDLQAEADKTANSIISATNTNKETTESAKYEPPTPAQQPSAPSKPTTPAPPSKGASVTVKKSATNFSRDGGNGTRMQSWVPGSTFTVYQVSGSEVLIGRNGGYTGWVKLSDIEGYASGAKSINKDQFAFLDELGEELQLVPDGAGRLSYVKKGTGIIPADLTERLMEWGQLDPSSVLEQSRPTVSVPHVINNNIELNMQVGEVVHIDHADNGSIPNITKAVQDQMDNYMKNINKKLYNRVR